MRPVMVLTHLSIVAISLRAKCVQYKAKCCAWYCFLLKKPLRVTVIGVAMASALALVYNRVCAFLLQKNKKKMEKSDIISSYCSSFPKVCATK